MRPALLRSVTPILFALAVYGPAARADVLRIVSSDERGVTLQVSTETWSLSAPGPDGRVHVVGVPDAHSLADPGHALLPVYSTMLALPPDARPTVRVISADAPVVRGGVRLAIARRPTFTPGERGEYEPGSAAVPALTDGAWPSEPTLLGAVGSFRGRRIVGLEVRPFQYDEAAATLRATASLVVRVDFNRPAGSAALPATVSAPDVHADAVLRSAVLNFDQAGPWRVAPAGASRPLFARPGSGQAGSQASFETQTEVRVTLDAARHDGYIGTDDASLVEQLELPVHCVAGDPRNRKVTTPEDSAWPASPYDVRRPPTRRSPARRFRLRGSASSSHTIHRLGRPRRQIPARRV